MSGEIEGRARANYKKAEDILKKRSIFTSAASKNTDAADLFIKAGNGFKACNLFQEAGDAYWAASQCNTRLNNFMDAATYASSASKMFAKSQQPGARQQALDSVTYAVQLYRENGKQLKAADLLKELATMYENSENPESAIEIYEQAASIYNAEDKHTQEAGQYEKIGDLYSKLGNYEKAGPAYKKMAELKIGDRLTQLSANEPLTKAVLCTMAIEDDIGAQLMINDWVVLSPSYERSREKTLIERCLKALEDQDEDAFSTAVFEYDRVTRLSPWYTSVLLAIKRRITNADDVC